MTRTKELACRLRAMANLSDIEDVPRIVSKIQLKYLMINLVDFRSDDCGPTGRAKKRVDTKMW